MRNLPGGHDSQLVLPVPALAEPTGQVVQLNCPVRLLYCPVRQLLQAVCSVDWPTCSLYLPAPQPLQLVMSSSLSTGPYVPTGQASQDFAFVNGFKVGFAMNVPGEQHPKRPVDVK